MEVGQKALAGEQNHGKGKCSRAMDGVCGTCSDRRSVCVGHRARVWSSGCGVICGVHLCWLEMCAGPVLRAGLRCAEVSFRLTALSGLLVMAENAGAPTLLITMKSLQIHSCFPVGMEGTLAHGSVRLCNWFCLIISHSLC